MYTIDRIDLPCFWIISEPGDATRYDYFVYVERDDFFFMPHDSSIPYPQRLNWWDVRNLPDERPSEDTVTLAREKMCNPWTLIECIRTMKKIMAREEIA